MLQPSKTPKAIPPMRGRQRVGTAEAGGRSPFAPTLGPDRNQPIYRNCGGQKSRLAQAVRDQTATMQR